MKIPNLSSSTVVTTATLSGLSLAGILLIYLWNRRRGYRKIGKISRLIIYPVKALKGVEVDRLEINSHSVVTYGKYRDRGLMLIDSDSNIITQRTEPTLVHVQPIFHNGNEIWFDAPGMPQLKIKLRERLDLTDNMIDANIWEHTAQGIDCGQEASEWFSKFLQKIGVRLIQHLPEFNLRPMRSRNQLSPEVEAQFPLIYQDRANVHLLNQQSLNELNNRLLNNKVTHENFRANIIVDECPAYGEDKWSHLKVSGVEFQSFIPCARCKVTTVNPQTAEFVDESLQTLRKYRLPSDKKTREAFSGSPFFGIYLGPLSSGSVQVGDECEAAY